MRIINEPAVTTLANADKLVKDNAATGVAAIAWSDFMAQIQALFLTNGKLSSSLVPSSFAGGISYKGTVVGASVPASSGATGDYYLISSAGTSQAITWAVGDFAVWNGAAWQKVAMAGAYTTPTDVANVVNPRAPIQGLVFDGTNGASVINAAALGTADWTVVAYVRPTAFNTFPRIIAIGADYNGVFLYSDGTIGFNDGADHALTGTALVANKMNFVCVRKSAGTVYASVNSGNEVALATSASLGAPSKIGSNGIGSNRLTGFIHVYVYNRALSTDEVLALYERGCPDSADYNSAGQSLVTGADSSFSSDTGFWSSGGTFTISGGTGNIGAASEMRRLNITSVGKKYLVTFSLSAISGTPLVALSDSSSNYATYSANGTYAVTITATGTTLQWSTDGGTTVSVDDVTVVPLGLICAPNTQGPGVGLVLNDQSGNGAHIVLPTSGVTWNIPTNAQFHVRGTTSTNGNQQLLGASVLPANCQITHVRARARTNTPTITIGTASGGAQIVASVALSTAWKDLTIALTGGIVSSASSVWIGSNSTDVVEIDITAEPLSF